MKQEIFYEDEYEGIRYRYGLIYRPVSIGSVPDGWIVGSIRPSNHRKYRHGTVDYPRALTEDERKSYELEYLGVGFVQEDFDEQLAMKTQIDAHEREARRIMRGDYKGEVEVLVARLNLHQSEAEDLRVELRKIWVENIEKTQ